MHPQAASILDRLSPGAHKTGKVPARLPLGLAALDMPLEGGLTIAALHEVRAPTARDIGAAAGLLFGLLAKLMAQTGRDRLLWVTDPAAGMDAGLLYPDGLAQYGLDPARVTLVTPVDLQTALWATDEAARCPDLAAVVLHVRGNPKQLDRVATRRLMLRARTGGAMVLILRQSGVEEASAAQTRWRVEACPSAPDQVFPAGVGLPQMTLALERCRTGRTGVWQVIWNPKHKGFEHGQTQAQANPQISVDRPATSAHRPDRTNPLGGVLDPRWTSGGRPADGAGTDGQKCAADRGP